MKVLSLSLSLLIGLLGAAADATAAPILYNINFTGGSPNPTSGSFRYDAAAAIGAQFSLFNVVWNGIAFDLTASANNPEQIGTGCPAGPTSATFFDVLSGVSQCTPVSAGRRWFVGIAGANLSVFSMCEQAANNSACSEQTGYHRAVSGLVATNSVTQTGGAFTITSAVPEPGTIWMTLIGSGGAVLAMRQRRKSLALTHQEATRP